MCHECCSTVAILLPPAVGTQRAPKHMASVGTWLWLVVPMAPRVTLDDLERVGSLLPKETSCSRDPAYVWCYHYTTGRTPSVKEAKRHP